MVGTARDRPTNRPAWWTHRVAATLPLLLLLAVAGACSSPRQPTRAARAAVIERGIASWYGNPFHGRQTANGERYDMHQLTAAHKTLPFGTVVEVHNLDNNRRVRVRINDRGPFVRGRIIDLSQAAARKIDMIGPGTAKVELVLVQEPGGVQTAARQPGPPPTAGAETPTGTRPIAWTGPWTVQIGAFQEPDRARNLRDLLARHYPDATVRSDGTWHKVQIGRYEKRRRAEKLQKELGKLGWEAVVIALQE